MKSQVFKARAKTGLCLAALVFLQACATGPSANPQDPLEPFNRGVTKFNDSVDEAFLKPIAKVYQEVAPAVVRTGVSNFFGNIADIWSFLNDVFQLKGQAATESLMRVGVNTVFGLGGFLDVASDLNIPKHREDFGQTLGYWGVGAGPYIVLPFMGSSTLRDSLGRFADTQGDGVRHIWPVRDRNSLYFLRVVDGRSDLLSAGDLLEQAALDKYSFTRDAYLQRRRYQVNDGADEEQILQEPELQTVPPASSVELQPVLSIPAPQASVVLVQDAADGLVIDQ